MLRYAPPLCALSFLNLHSICYSYLANDPRLIIKLIILGGKHPVTGSLQASLHIHLFRTFEVSLEGLPVARFEADTARALLAYLAAQPGAAIQRETLAALLWDAQDTATALTNLRSALRRIRTALDTAGASALASQIDYIIADRTTLTFNAGAPAWIDVLAFEERLAAVHRHQHTVGEECPHCIELLSEAAALYRGAFLADIAIATQGFEEWRRSERERLQRLAMSALYSLGEHAFRTGNFGEADRIARRQLNIERWNEEAHRQLMRILFASGRRTAALAQYDICRNALAEELGIDPDDETQTLFLRLLAGESPMPRSVGRSPYKGLSPFGPHDTDVFFGRSAVTQRLHAAVAGPGVAVIVGASGSGKSSVINAGLVPTLLGQLSEGFSALAAPSQEQVITRVVLMRPGHDPVAALDEALSGPAVGDATPQVWSHTLLIVDQFEELFTTCPDCHSTRRRR